MLRKIIYVTLFALAMTGTALAQMPQPGVHLKDDKPSRTKEQKAYEKALDRSYQSTLKEIPEQKKKTDPWGDIRSPPPAAGKNKQQ